MQELRKGVAHEKPLNGIDSMQTIILNGVINKLANYCMLDNPRFDRDKFIKATQLTEEEKRLAI